MGSTRRSKGLERGLLAWRAQLFGDGPRVVLEGPIKEHREWRVALTFYGVDDRLVLAEVKVFPSGDRLQYMARHGEVPPVWPTELLPGMWSPAALADVGGGGITARLLRDIELGGVTPTVRTALEQLASLSRPDAAARSVARAWSAVIRTEEAKPRSAGRSDHYYAIWAARYVRHDGKRYQRKAFAEAEGLTGKQADALLAEARNRLLLTSRGQGRAGGELTTKGQQLLAEVTKSKQSNRRKR
jgi:hypothetical protein